MTSDGISKKKKKEKELADAIIKTAADLSTKTMCVVTEGDGYENLVCYFWN